MPDEPLTLASQKVDIFKYFGVLLSQDMSWSPHVQATCSKTKKGSWSTTDVPTLIPSYSSTFH